MKAPQTHVLVVDDNADMREMLKILLESAGYSVSTAANGAAALAAQRQRPAGIMITDLFMPESDGFEAIQAMRQEFPATRIVVISGDNLKVRMQYLKVAEMIGVDATLQKPFEAVQLLQTLESLKAQ